jgi:hypothetical protein
MLRESIQILWTTFVEEKNLEKNIQEMYVEDRLVQNYFNDMRHKKKVRGITLLDELLRWK